MVTCNMVTVHLYPSPRRGKKWRVTFQNGKSVDFGQVGYADYTMHKDPARMKRYLVRHARHESWTDAQTAGFWSRWLLWSKPTLEGAKKLIRSKFKINFVRR